MVAGLSSGAVSVVFMNPIDVIRTRYYNQHYSNGKGISYTSGIDAFHKIITNEGGKAFYKGFFSHFLRIGPHFCLTFMFLGIFRRSTCDYYAYLDQKDAFKSFDLDHNGKLDKAEVQKALEKVVEGSIDEKDLRAFTREVLGNKSDIDFSEYQSRMEQRLKELYLKYL
jgi:Mitochondrial carrier protein/EF-hand domain